MTDIFVRSYTRRYTRCRIDDELHTRLRVELALNEWAEEFLGVERDQLGRAA